MVNTSKLSKMDRQYIKLKYGSVREYKKMKREKQLQEQKEIQLEQDIKVRELLTPYFERIKADHEQQQLIQKKNDIRESMSKLYSKQYNKWLIVWDLLNSSYYEIKTALNKEKIAIDDITEVINNCNKIHEIFNLNDTMKLIQ